MDLLTLVTLLFVGVSIYASRRHRPGPGNAPTPGARYEELTGDALTEQLRAAKRLQRKKDLAEWDREWNRLLGAPAHEPSESVAPRLVKPEPTSIQPRIRDISNSNPLAPSPKSQPKPHYVGESVVILKRIPANLGYTAQAEPGDVGLVTHIGRDSSVAGLRAIQVRLDRTGELLTVVERNLASL
jgi:hypothetical protein